MQNSPKKNDKAIHNQNSMQLLRQKEAAEDFLEQHKKRLKRVKTILEKPIEYDYFKFLTNQTGIIQHATHGIPDFRNGYSVDDNARALLVAVEEYRQTKDKDFLRLAKIYLSFLDYMQDSDGRFYTYLSFKLDYPNDEKSEDAYGRAMWGIGFAISCSADEDIKRRANEIFDRGMAVDMLTLRSPRTWAYCIFGLYYHFREKQEKRELLLILELADKLMRLYETCRDEKNNWYWFEDRLTYGNVVLPLALLLTYNVTEDKKYKDAAEESLSFLLTETDAEDYVFPIGEKGWYVKGKEKSLYDQQPIEAGYTVWALWFFYRYTRRKIYLDYALRWFLWYYGENSLKMKLYEEKTGICRDGLTPLGVNRNGGSESISTYLLARLHLAKLLLKD